MGRAFILIEFTEATGDGAAPIGMRAKGERAEFRDWVAERYIARGMARRVDVTAQNPAGPQDGKMTK